MLERVDMLVEHKLLVLASVCALTGQKIRRKEKEREGQDVVEIRLHATRRLDYSLNLIGLERGRLRLERLSHCQAPSLEAVEASFCKVAISNLPRDIVPRSRRKSTLNTAPVKRMKLPFMIFGLS